MSRLLASPRRLLSSILLGNNLANTGAAAVGAAIATDVVSGWAGVLAATLIMTVLLVVFGEVGPKTVALHHNFSVARAYALPLGGWTRLTAPVVWVLDGISRGLLALVGERGERGPALSLGELRTAIRLGAEGGAIERDESAMLLSALALPTQQVRRIMTPRVQIAAVEASTPLAEVARQLAALGYLRLLVHEGSPDDIVGYVHVSDVNAAQASGRGEALAREVMREPLFESERARVAGVLEAMQESGTHLVVLIDEFGATAGIVTLEDVLEEVVGEIRSESGPQRGEEAPVRVGGRLYVEGQRALGQLGAELGVELPHAEAETAGGLVLAHLRHMPARGETVDVSGYRFTVLSADERRVRLVAVEALPGGVEGEGEGGRRRTDAVRGSGSGWASGGRGLVEFVIFAACALAIALAGPLLVDAVEGVAEETGLGRLWLGTVLLAGATSLPELVSVVTAARIDEPDIAVGTVLGSNLFNMTIFGAVLVLFPLAVRSNRGGALTGALAITMAAAALVFLLLEGPAVGRFGLGALLLGGLYVAGSFGLFRAERSGRPRAAELPGSAGLSRVRVAAQWTSMRGDVARLAVATAVVFVASLFLPDAAEEIAATLGVSGGVVGVVGVALATSLPEVVTSTVALRRGAPELVVGNVFGSNVFNLAALFAAEAALEEGRLLQVVDGDQAVTAAFGLGVMVLALGPLLRTPGAQQRRRWFRLLGVAILLGYVSGVVTAVSLGVETR